MCLSCMVLVIFALLVTAAFPAYTQEDHVWSVTGVVGQPSDLPCYLNPRTPGDRPKLILWYKRGTRTPVFSHDGRVPQMKSDVVQNGGTLTVSRRAATLTLHNLTKAQAGVYECRVDFFKSPTHTNFVNLTIVEPPSSLEVIDIEGGTQRGAGVAGGLLGPYREGASLTLSCVAKGGSPSPNVTWWRGEKQLSETWYLKGPDLVMSDLRVERLTRDWHNTSLKCEAKNTILAEATSITVVVQMFLLPRKVEISNPGAAREGREVRLVCTSSGSRPSATLTWTIRGVSKLAHKENLVYGDVTSSTLVTNVTRDDHNTKVTCLATNPAAPDQPVSNSTLLVVYYPPTVTASLGRSLRPEILKEGDDVYFTCTVAANPEASTITWYHEDRPQKQNVSEGVILTGDSLVLQQVGRRQAGSYTCSAANQLSSATSQPVTLRIKYKPVCQTSPTTYFIYDKPINVTCSVSSYPPVSSIQWQWNSSNDVLSTSVAGELEERAWAQLTVQPTQSREDRTLTCWAVNEMGKQTTPCGFSVKVAQTPLPLSSCRLANITASSLSLTCQRPDVAAAGTTLYRAEVYFKNRTLFANVTSRRPNFNVSRLDAGTSYQIKVYVTHGPVTSQPVVVSAYTSRTSRTPKDSRGGGSSVGKVVGVLGLLVLLVGAGVWARHLRRRRGEVEAEADAAAAAAAAAEMDKRKLQNDKGSTDEINPDVVPTSVEDTFDLLAAGVKAELPILTPVYEAVGLALPESVPRKSMASAEVYAGVRGPHKDSGSDDEGHRLPHHRRDSEGYSGLQILHQSPTEDLTRHQLKDSPEDLPRVRFKHEEESQEYPLVRQPQRDVHEDFPRVRFPRKVSIDLAEMSLIPQKDSYKDFPGATRVQQQQRTSSPHDYATLKLQHRDSEDRAELYCPVDQLMQAAETIV